MEKVSFSGLVGQSVIILSNSSLSVFMTRYLPLQAKEMVELSKSIANKIKDKQGDITEDEVSFREWLQVMSTCSIWWSTGEEKAKQYITC